MEKGTKNKIIKEKERYIKNICGHSIEIMIGGKSIRLRAKEKIKVKEEIIKNNTQIKRLIEKRAIIIQEV